MTILKIWWLRYMCIAKESLMNALDIGEQNEASQYKAVCNKAH